MTTIQTAHTHPDWPALPLAEWADTYATVHRWMQIVGKTRLHYAPMQNHWWNAALYLTARGIGTSPMPVGERHFEIELDFIDHVLVARSSDGRTGSLPLVARTVADFYGAYVRMLREIGIEPDVWPVPVELGDRLRFDADDVHASYDPDAANRCWRVLAQSDRVLKSFRGRFLGKSSPSHFWWGSFDLSCTRFSGRGAPTHPGGVPNCPDYVTREAYSHECISVGWWPGSVGALEEPAFYAYAYPESPAFPSAAIRPGDAYYHAAMREWILPYDAVRSSGDPDGLLLAFWENTYSAAADLGGWDREKLERANDRTRPA
jgi:hypothetical protein